MLTTRSSGAPSLATSLSSSQPSSSCWSTWKRPGRSPLPSRRRCSCGQIRWSS